MSYEWALKGEMADKFVQCVLSVTVLMMVPLLASWTGEGWRLWFPVRGSLVEIRLLIIVSTYQAE